VTGPVTTDMATVVKRKRDMVQREIAAHLHNYKTTGAELIMGNGAWTRSLSASSPTCKHKDIRYVDIHEDGLDEAFPEVALPARHGRDVGLHGSVAFALRDLRVAA
jgi:hypothetical protein